VLLRLHAPDMHRYCSRQDRSTQGQSSKVVHPTVQRFPRAELLAQKPSLKPSAPQVASATGLGRVPPSVMQDRLRKWAWAGQVLVASWQTVVVTSPRLVRVRSAT